MTSTEEVEEEVVEFQGKGVDWASMSYSKQYDLLFKSPLDTKRPIPKPSKAAQAAEPGGVNVFMSDVVAIKKKPEVFRQWNSTDLTYLATLGIMHVVACLAPFTFSMPMLYLFIGSYFVTGCLGITLSYHRQLSHRSFQTPKWLEYVLAYCGAMAVQGDPMEWVSCHRYHHLHTETPLDPHSPYEGFWFSHAGWLLDNKVRRAQAGAGRGKQAGAGRGKQGQVRAGRGRQVNKVRRAQFGAVRDGAACFCERSSGVVWGCWEG